ncbi:hypothetical protein K8O78_12650 [Escherichia coli]|nr:hypothetical protein K8O78_12650 [Escherichia coli]
MIWQPEFTDKTLSRKPGAVQKACPVVLRERFHQQCKCRFNWSTQQLCENMGLRRFGTMEERNRLQ